MSAETMRRAIALALENIRTGGGHCELQVWPDQVHVFQALPRLSPEAAKAMALVARFIDTSLRARGFDAAAGKAG